MFRQEKKILSRLQSTEVRILNVFGLEAIPSGKDGSVEGKIDSNWNLLHKIDKSIK
jgi:hypothetical protein